MPRYKRRMGNRLAGESSPYLRQHADNPVEWWPWGSEAFAEAKRRDVPVFVSIGYAACHWCHVMAHESFENPGIADLMNRAFVNVKVDREERPDVDAIFMNAIMVQGEGGGWPLSAFCLPDGRPYFLGTYFPPVERFGRPSFPDLLGAMGDAYRARRAEAIDNAEQLLDGLQRIDAHYRGAGAATAEVGALDASLLIAAARGLADKTDKVHGGITGAPKFPSSASHELLARAARMVFGEAARSAFDGWARGMAEGGIYDHLGGGFARYSVDAKWVVPHFEKMLYDQAQLLGIYAAVVAQGGPFATRAAEVIAETIAFMERELSDAQGGLWSSLDADSEGEEGTFYVWTPAQVRVALGRLDGLLFTQAYGVTEQGSFERGTSVLQRVAPRTSALEEEHLAELRSKLATVRAARERPSTDDKVLAGWNGLAISGLVAAWRATGAPAALALAMRIGEFLRAAMVQGDRIARVHHQGVTKELDGTLEDYAYCAVAFLDLAEATGQRAWWDLGARLLATVRARFVTDEGGVVVFYLAPAGDPLLVHRPESHHDGALPSGAAKAVLGLVRLGLVADDQAALALGERYLAQRLTGTPGGAAAWTNATLLAALDLYLHAQVLVVTSGPDRDALIAAARRAYAPTLCLAGDWAAPSVLADKSADADGRVRAFVCRGPRCAPPVSEPAALVALLTALPT